MFRYPYGNSPVTAGTAIPTVFPRQGMNFAIVKRITAVEHPDSFREFVY
jgi:hypothetical protein